MFKIGPKESNIARIVKAALQKLESQVSMPVLSVLFVLSVSSALSLRSVLSVFSVLSVHSVLSVRLSEVI